MAIIKCKMCGGDLEIQEGISVAECEYCGTQQTVPNVDNEKKLTLFNRANRLRAACEFDKAAGVYEAIVADFPEESEAYWGLVLCKYGIEYVDDPATGKKIPTCHRSSFESVMDDENLEQAQENADAVAQKVYREEAKQFERIRKGILEVSSNEQPYDIFICYKETDDKGGRTIDSLIAQDIYDALNAKGYRVFFSRITLEDKLGVAYEPYIFSALNSAKVMLAVGTCYEHYHAVWVKNEWSRYLKICAADKGKHLIPCFKDLDPEDMPKEFRHLQGQDMGKVGAIQDLLRGIEKLLPKQAPVQKETIVVQQSSGSSPNVQSLLKRAYIFMEDGDWARADDLCEQVLNQAPECAEAYLGKLMVECKVHKQDDLASLEKPFDNSNNFQKILRFGDESLKNTVEGYVDAINCRIFKEKEKILREKQKKITELKPIREKLKSSFVAVCVGDSHTVGLKSDGTVVAVGDNRGGRCDVTDWKDIVAVCVGDYHTVGLKSDGTVVAVGDNRNGRCDVADWKDIVAVCAGNDHTVGLKSDGTVVAVGSNNPRRCDVAGWKDIVAVCAGNDHTVGLKSDGTVVVAGRKDKGRYDVADWKDIVAVCAGEYHIIGLKSDGTVVAVGSNSNVQRDVTDWKDIVAVCTVGYHNTIGLKSDGTVVAVGSRDVADWKDIVAVCAGSLYTVGLKSDGTVIAVGYNSRGQCNVADWKDIVAVCAGHDYTIGLKSDGTVVAVGKNEDGQCDVSDWKLFDSIDDAVKARECIEEAAAKRKEEAAKRKEEAARLDAERKTEQARLEAEYKAKRKATLESRKIALNTELFGLKGMFSARRRKEVEEALTRVERELRGL